MVLASFLDPVLSWVLILPLWLGIAVLALIITLLVNLVHKYTTDQNYIRQLKADMKNLQKEIKKHKDNPQKQLKLQQQIMQINGKLMSKSLKPMIFTMLPLLIIFGWMSANLAYEPLQPGQEVVVTMLMREPALVNISSQTADILTDPQVQTIEQLAKWKISGDEGEHLLVFTTDTGESVTRDFLVGKKPTSKIVKHEPPFKQSEIRYEKAKPFGSFSIFGYKPGWLFTYIFFSVVFSLITRKLMGLH